MHVQPCPSKSNHHYKTLIQVLSADFFSLLIFVFCKCTQQDNSGCHLFFMTTPASSSASLSVPPGVSNPHLGGVGSASTPNMLTSAGGGVAAPPPPSSNMIQLLRSGDAAFSRSERIVQCPYLSLSLFCSDFVSHEDKFCIWWGDRILNSWLSRMAV